MGYRGEVFLKFKPSAIYAEDIAGESTDSETFDFVTLPNDEYDYENYYNVGDRIGQIMIIPFPKVEFVEVDQLSDTERGATGFGSSGK